MSAHIFKAKLLARTAGTYESYRWFTSNVVASSLEVAIRLVRKAAKRDGLQVQRFVSIKDLGTRDA